MVVEWPTTWEGLRAMVLREGRTSAVVLPDAGAKVVSLVLHGQEVLWRNPHVPVRAAPYAARYRDYGASGMDVCFPSIAAARVPTPSGELIVPDHGEVWALPWAVDATRTAARVSVEGRAWPYRLEMALALVPGALKIVTTLQNRAGEAFPYLWALHPVVPLTPRTAVRWPRRAGEEALADVVSRPGRTPPGYVSKVFLGPLAAGEAVVAQDEGSVRLAWDAGVLPYLGVWISNQDERGPGGRRCLAVEPSVAPTDSLEDAVRTGQAAVLAPGQTRVWQVTVQYEPAGFRP